MKKALFLLVAGMFPTLLCAQALNQALQQLEQMTGQTIDDVYVPDPGDPVPVDPDPEEEPQQSTHLKDYTPAQEQEEEEEQTTTRPAQPAPEPKPKTAQELWEEELQRQREREREYNQKYVDAQNKYYEDIKEHEAYAKERYERLKNERPTVRAVPQFSSSGERNFQFDHPMSAHELKYSYDIVLENENDTLYHADIMRFVQPGGNALQPSTVRFLGTRMPGGRVEWRMFKERPNIRDPHRTLTIYREEEKLSTESRIKAKDIWDVKMAAEGRVMILEMKNGNNVVIRPNGDFLCEGRNISFPAMMSEGVFVECDGKLYSSIAPRYTGPLIEGDHFEYYNKTIIVQNHDANNEPYYRLTTYGGKSYDIKKHQWTDRGEQTRYSYLSHFSNDGDYYVVKPQGKNYYEILADCGTLFKGKKKYKTLEEAHAAWQKEKAYIIDTWNRHPEKCAKIDKR